MESDEPLGRDASDWVAIDEAPAGQVLAFVLDTSDIVPASSSV
jgi:hypothetical protein